MNDKSDELIVYVVKAKDKRTKFTDLYGVYKTYESAEEVLKNVRKATHIIGNNFEDKYYYFMIEETIVQG